MIVKLTNKDGQTHGGTQWGENIRHTAAGIGNTLCSSAVIHYYDDEYLAVFANPRHCNFNEKEMQMWEFLPDKKINGDALKSACKSGITVRKVKVPKITKTQRVEIGIRCALVVSKDKKWIEWANNWLSKKDRTKKSAADAAAYAAYANAAYAAYANAAADATAAEAYAAYANAAADDAAAYANAAAYAAAAEAKSKILDVTSIIHLVIDRDKEV